MTLTRTDWPAEMAGWDQARVLAFRQDLLAWYDQNKRDLPWRRSQDPYHIWVSEIMLQQTQVTTVIPYYERFIGELPTVEDLAQAPESMLLNLWQGLGYYSRVRNMQVAAQQILADYGGKMPGSYDALIQLKGIGPYTAAAIASMAFDQVVPALDGNLFRIVARLFRLDSDIRLPKTRKQFMHILNVLIDPDRPGDFNQAMMDLGAGVMTPTNDRPHPHPLAAYDASYQMGDSERYPVKSKQVKASRHEWTAYFIVDEEGRWLLRRHGEGELLKGLWHFPLIEQALIYEEIMESDLLDPLQDLVCQQALAGEGKLDFRVSAPHLGRLKHVFSHRIWQVTLVGIELKGALELPSDWCKVYPYEVGQLPLSSLQEKMMELILGEEGIR